MLHLTTTHPCGYLPMTDAATLFVDGAWPMTPPLYEWLLERGFRRSGPHVYKPFCHTCHACIPVRLPVQRFRLRRSLRRVLNKNSDLTISIHQGSCNEERFALYTRYLGSRHADGPMAASTPKDFCDFLLCEWGDTRFVEFRHERRLLAVAVMDVLPGALSAAYTFFDPIQQHRSLGSLAILWQIQHALQMQISWLYLGYWIKNCRKMSYKSRFQPLEGYLWHHWATLEL
ncbi:MAG: arginyltransferase [Magnetococcales bacterium]|nr:arginyltransferase [Magnetococcales bacterium]